MTLSPRSYDTGRSDLQVKRVENRRGEPRYAALVEQATESERLGRWPQATELYDQAFSAALYEGETLAAVDALRGEARALQHLEELEAAEEIARLSFEIAERNGFAQAAARALNILAVTRYLQRNWSEAQALYEEALERALDIGDDELIGYTCQNLGVIANILGHLREARVRYLESIGSAVRSGRKANEAAAYNNLGMVCADLGEWMEAVLYFDRGIEIAERIGDLAQTARLYANRAEPLLSIGEFSQARASLRRAEELAERVDARATLADVARFRCRIHRLEDDLEAAERELQRGWQFARDSGLPLARAELLEETGYLRRAQGQEAQARTALQEAHAAFLALGAVRDAARVEEMQIEPSLVGR